MSISSSPDKYTKILSIASYLSSREFSKVTKLFLFSQIKPAIVPIMNAPAKISCCGHLNNPGIAGNRNLEPS